MIFLKVYILHINLCKKNIQASTFSKHTYPRAIPLFFMVSLISFILVGCNDEPTVQGNKKFTASQYHGGSNQSNEQANGQTKIISYANANGYILRNDTGNRIANTAAGENTILVGHQGLEPNHVRGARIYDDFIIELTATPIGINPIIAIATPTDPAMAVPTDVHTWRCSHCHGFDYEGGVYTFNNGATNNLLELRDVRKVDEEYVIHMLLDGFDAWDGTGVINVHNYSGLLTPQAMVDVADFVVNEIFDTHQYIQAPSSGGLGPAIEGDELYNSMGAAGAIPPIIRVDGSNFNCVDCHGADGLLVAGVDLFTLAWTQPFEWLHRVNFGSPRSLATYPDFSSEDTTVHPGLYETIITDGLYFGGPEQAAEIMSYSQANLTPAP